MTRLQRLASLIACGLGRQSPGLVPPTKGGGKRVGRRAVQGKNAGRDLLPHEQLAQGSLIGFAAPTPPCPRR